MTGIKVQPDTVYGLGTVAVRFTVEQGIPQALIPVLAVPYIKKAIEQFERLGDGKGHKYKFRDDIPIRFEYSRLQGDPYKIHTSDFVNYEERLFGEGLVDCVAILTFEQPLVYLPLDSLRPLGPEDGNFVDDSQLPSEIREHMYDDIPQELKQFMTGGEENQNERDKTHG